LPYFKQQPNRPPKPQPSSDTVVAPSHRRWSLLATCAVTLAIAALAGGLAAVVVIRAGWYDVGAIVQHWQPSFSMMEYAMRSSVRRNARGIATPPFTEALVRRGALVYQRNCLQCHGAPGIEPDGIGLSMQPLPGPLVHMMRRWRPNEVYWIISNGVKMSGMPAWRYRLSDDDLWAVTALVARLPSLSTQDYAALQADAQDAPPVAPAMPNERLRRLYKETPVSAMRGKEAIPQYACQSCHVIPGIVGSQATVGPALDDYAKRTYIAGYLPNTPENLVRWLRSPQQVKPHSAMPDLHVSERDAADIAAYLRTPDGG
jgi:mono/diheme cytochrome c family protein